MAIRIHNVIFLSNGSKTNKCRSLSNYSSTGAIREPKTVYYLYGQEEFYLDRLVDFFGDLLPAHEKDFNFDLLYGQEVTPAKVLAIARSFPMMAELRVLMVRNFLQTAKGASGEGDMNDFIPYFEQPNPSCLFVMFDTGKPAGNTKSEKHSQKIKT